MHPWSLAAALHILAGAAFAQSGEQVDPKTLYEVTTQGSSQKIKAGGTGKLVLALKNKNGSHISTEAPFKIEVSGKGVQPAKAQLSLADAVQRRAVPGGVADPQFEIPFAAPAAGHGEVAAKMTFFVCTEKICARQQKAVAVPVDVD